MKRTTLLLSLLLLVGGSACAQTKKTTKTTVRITHYTAQPTMMYFGITGGEYLYTGTKDGMDYEYEGILLGVQGGYLYSLFGDINRSFSPYVGGEGSIGINPDEYGLVVQAGVNAGIMLGKPTFRLDVRLQPQLTYFGSGRYDYYVSGTPWGDYFVDRERKPSLRPNLAIRLGLWISRFNIYFQYHNIVSAGLGWRF
jgi:hypothetical protein